MLAWPKIISNTFAQLVAKGVAAGATLIIFAALSRTNDPAGLGVYSLVTTLFATAFVVVDWGLNVLFVQQYAQRQRKGLIVEIFGSRLLLSLVLVLVIAILGIVLSSAPATRAGYPQPFLFGTLILLPTLCFQAVSFTMNGFFQARLQYGRWAMAVAIGASGSMIGAMLLFASRAPLVLYFFIPVLSSFLTAAASLWFGQFSPSRFLSWSISAAWRFLRNSFPLAATLSLNVVFSRFDIFLLAATRGTVEVGQYNVAYLLFSNLLVIPTFIVNTIYPQWVRFSPTKMRGSLIHASATLFLLSIVVAGVSWVVGPPFISLLFGRGFEPAAATLQILLFSLPFFFLSAPAMIVLLVRRAWWTLAWIYGAGFALNIIGNILFQPAFGMTAAAWLTVATELVVLILLGLALLRTKKERR